MEAIEWLASVHDWLNDLVANEGTTAGYQQTPLVLASNQDYVSWLLRSTHWLRLLMRASCEILELGQGARAQALKLVSLGKRKGVHFLAQNLLGHPSPFFGLSNPVKLLSVLPSEETRIDLLRKVAKDLGLDNSAIIIRYVHQDESTDEKTYEYASAVPMKTHSNKRSRSGTQMPVSYHKRWISMRPSEQNMMLRDSSAQPYRASQSRTSGSSKGIAKRAPPDPPPVSLCRWNCPCEKYVEGCMEACHGDEIRQQCEVDDDILSRWSDAKQWNDEISKIPEACSMQKLLSFTNIVSSRDPTYPFVTTKKAFDDTWALNTPELRRSRVALALEDAPWDQKQRAAATDVYKLLLSSTIDLGVTLQPFRNAHWVCSAQNRALRPKQTAGTSSVVQGSHLKEKERFVYHLDRPETFSCIAMFESGSLNTRPSALSSVMAMSTGNSIFVSAPLLCDPSEAPLPHEVRRVVGNIGRAGIAMLIPPQNPKITTFKPETWSLINHSMFDGKIEDSFQHTSLHLSFTPYSLALIVGDHGAQDKEAFLLEALVSIHDRDKWVADLDILKTFQSPLFSRIQHNYSCNHTCTCGHTGSLPKSSGPAVLLCPYINDCTICRPKCGCEHIFGCPGLNTDSSHRSNYENRNRGAKPLNLASLDNWEDIIEREDMNCLVRANGNWLARLAATVLSVAQGHETIVLSNPICWGCVNQKHRGATTYIC
ncbi:hypothetical protein BKA64DRAFT_643248 [Cadophora sp. MPI-SDFR-AT-0126]|nr:hypothetical protein BKA64DRAFT_643248 [Leotiomycetes sp. MPI-SDFR-AT-0126]